jgi:hypothetical protein
MPLASIEVDPDFSSGAPKSGKMVCKNAQAIRFRFPKMEF